MEKKIKLLIVDDEARFLRTLSQRLTLRDFDVTPVTSGREAIDLARRKAFDIALLDLKMPGMAGEEVLEILKRDHPLLEVIILTGHGSIDSAVNCTKAGSYQYLQKPCETDELLHVLRMAYQKRVQRKLSLSEKKIQTLLQASVNETALGILRRLKDLEAGNGKNFDVES